MDPIIAKRNLEIMPPGGNPPSVAPAECREWLHWAISEIEGDYRRSADTHLVRLDVAVGRGIDVYLKDESTHPTGSLKHRLARSLFLYGLCNGSIRRGTTIVEASSGSTAISEAYFAKLLGLPFVAVMPAGTSQAKIQEIERLGGTCRAVEGDDIYGAARALATESAGHYMDQFTFAERATDWRGNNNIAESIFHQMGGERYPIPSWIVVGAGTGGTSATIGRYLRYRSDSCRACRLAVVDPENSVFAESWRSGRDDLVGRTRGRIEGIGRPRVEPSFQPLVIDRMIEVADATSYAAARLLSERLGRRVGASTGTNFAGILAIAAEMASGGQHGSIVSLICDSGDRYADTLFDDDWIDRNILDYRHAYAGLLRKLSAAVR